MNKTMMADTMTLTSNRSAALRGNDRATRHGLRASSLPPGCSYLESQLTAFRRYVRDELIERDGRTTTYQEAVLQSAVRHETRCLLALRWLRKEADNLDMPQRMALLKEIGNATDRRDACLEKLGLDRDAASDAIDVLYAAEYDADATLQPSPTERRQANPIDSTSGERNAVTGRAGDDRGTDD